MFNLSSTLNRKEQLLHDKCLICNRPNYFGQFSEILEQTCDEQKIKNKIR